MGVDRGCLEMDGETVDALDEEWLGDSEVFAVDDPKTSPLPSIVPTVDSLFPEGRVSLTDSLVVIRKFFKRKHHKHNKMK